MMLVLNRIYLKNSTIGVFTYDDVVVCCAFELPNLNNQKSISCIPSGVYDLKTERHEKLGKVIRLSDVKDRSGILIHAANNISQLRGCIASCLNLNETCTGGFGSQKALEKIYMIVQKSPGLKLVIQ